MHERPPVRSLARAVSDYVGGSMLELIDRIRPHGRAGTGHNAAEHPLNDPPTIDDLELAGTEWTPLSEDDEDGYLIARDNGYVIIRGSDPDTPIRTFDEDDWDMFMRGDTTDGWPPAITEDH